MAGKRKISSAERRTLRAVAVTLIPGKAGLPAAERAVPVADPVADFLEGLSRRRLTQIRLVLGAFELSPLLSGRLKRFSGMREADRARHLRSLETSRLSVKRDLLLFVKLLCSLGYGRNRSVQERIGCRSTCALREGSDPARKAAPRLEPESLRPIDTEIEVDVVIVGSGAGGAVAAYELARSGLSVAVLEEGSFYDRRVFKADPLHALATLYRDRGLTFLAGRPAIPLPVGRCVGGTTVVNSGTCFRAPDRTLEGWRSRYGVEWAQPQVLNPVYEELERNLLIEPVDLATMGNNGRLCREGAQALGASGGPISRYANGCLQCGSCPTGCPIDIKQATHVSYMPRAVAAGAKLCVRTRAERVLIDSGQVVGVDVAELDPNGGVVSKNRVRAKTVVLAAGALGTPELLLRSGLAETHPHVGRNLHIHPACWIGGLYDEEVRGWEGIMQSYYVDEWRDQGLLLEATFTPLPFAGPWLPGCGEAFERSLASFGRIASIGVHLSDTSSGRVRLNRRGDVALTYKLRPDDVRRIVAGVAHAADIHFAAGAKEVYPHVGRTVRLLPGEQRSLERRRFKAHQLRLEAFHPMGTARLGASRSTSVTAPNGEVHGVNGLYVTDASLFPTSLGVNPMLTIMAFATYIARGLAQRVR